MNVSLDNIVNINISVSPTPVALVGFGGFMILQSDNASNLLSKTYPIKKYMKAEDVLSDFDSDSLAYKAAVGFFSQSPTPSEFYVGLHSESTVVASLANIQKFNNDWYHFCQTVIEMDDVSGLAGWAEANKKMLYMESSLNGKNTSNSNILDPIPANASLDGKTFGYDDSDNVYGFNVGEFTVNDLASTLQAGSYKHVALFYNSNPANVGALEASVAGRIATVDFNNGTDSTISLHLKELPTIFPESIDNNQLAILKSKNCNVFTIFATSQLVYEGMTTEGSYVDQTVGLDWLENYLQINLFNFMKAKNKVPYTRAGTEMLAQDIERSLKQAVNNGFFAPNGTTIDNEFLENGFKVDAGDFTLVTTADKATRVYNRITFKGIMAGAIHNTTVNGVVEF